MSYEGKTTNVLKHGFAWTGQAYTAPPDPSQTTRFSYLSSRLGLSNTFHFNWMKLQSTVGYASTQWVYALQTAPSAPSTTNLQGWDMYDSNGSFTTGGRWYPPYSHGIANQLYRTSTSFINSTGNVLNRYLSLEY